VDTVPGVISIADVAQDGGMLGMTSVADEGSCWGLFKVWKPKPAWETCDYTLFDFSPSGERILAGPSYLDGFGQGIAAVLDRDGEVLGRMAQPWSSHDPRHRVGGRRPRARHGLPGLALGNPPGGTRRLGRARGRARAGPGRPEPVGAPGPVTGHTRPK